MHDLDILKKKIGARASQFLKSLYGNRLHYAGPGQWRVGTRGSLAIDLKDGEIVYYDHEAGSGGDCIGLWARECLTNGEAIKACASWLGVSDEATTNNAPVAPPVPADEKLSTRPQPWPFPDPNHIALWNSGVDRVINDAQTREVIARWRGWTPDAIIPLARARLISVPLFDLWPSVIPSQLCAAFPVIHPVSADDGSGAVWMGTSTQMHIRFHPGAVRCDGSPLSWIYAPTMKQVGRDDGGNAPLMIARNASDPEQPRFGQRCRCVIVCAGEWDAVSLLLASNWLREDGALLLPPGLAIIAIRGEGRGGVDAYLRFYNHWKPDVAIMVADADATGLSWFHPSADGRPGFAQLLEQRGAKVIPRVPKIRDGIKDINDLYRAGLLDRWHVEALLMAAQFNVGGGPQ